jgi:hypothetical protein
VLEVLRDDERHLVALRKNLKTKYAMMTKRRFRVIAGHDISEATSSLKIATSPLQKTFYCVAQKFKSD